ncbi:MAG: hypothetical protein QNJ54_24350 [Prochloraceae cyanobacterium]|nr:hypothetical protein [Prochloraceae cyanobacterium]
METAHNKNKFLSRFFNYIYKGEIESPVRTIEALQAEIKRIEEGDKIKANQELKLTIQESFKREQVISQVILNVNKLLTFICIGSFIVMVVYPFVYPDKPIPDIIQNTFFTTLGWFGSAFANRVNAS